MLAIIFCLALPGGVYSAEKDTYRVPLASEPITLDPAKFSGIYAMTVANNLFDGLVEFDENINVRPAIARIWKISRDHKTYTFKLRKGVKFHNGREVTAGDFVISFQRILDPKVESPVASLFMKIKGAKAFAEGKSDTVSGLSAKGDHTLVIRLEEPFAPFLSILAMANAKVVPQEALNGDFDKAPVGTGPFKFASWSANQQIVLTANSGYFGEAPKLKTVRFKIYQNVDWDTIYRDFEQGLLDQSLVAGDHSFNEAGSPDLVSKPGLNVVYLGMNTSLPAFKDRRVRQAVYYAVDREKIVREHARWRSVPATGVLPPGIAGFDPYYKGYAYDPDKARRLLSDAGFPNGKGIPPIELWTVSKTERVKKQLEAYQRYLGQVGIEVTLKVAANWKEFVQKINDKQAAMFYAAWYADFPDPDNFLYTLCHSNSRTNRMNYENPEVDRLLDQARSETDYEKRVELYRKIEKLVLEDAPVVAQHYNSTNYVFQPWVKGVEMSHLGATYLSLRKVQIDGKN
jgi:peptide/nickel transport system substrate-binding protein/oligopeptide transport system substrate-binding protein